MSNNVTYNVHITNIMGAVIGVARSQPECLSIEDAIKLGLETIETIENMYYEDYGFIITDSRGVIYNRTGKQISGHKWTWWFEGTTGKARIFHDEESAVHEDVKKRLDAHPWLTECAYFVRPVPANTMVYEVTIGNWKKGTRHLIQRDKAAGITKAEKDCWAVEFSDLSVKLFETEVQANRCSKHNDLSYVKPIRLFEYQGYLLGPVKVEAASEDDLKEQTTIDAKHQAITRARGLGLSDEELKAMGVEV